MTADGLPFSDIQTLPSTIHGTCVCVAGAGLLIVGPSGSGKSAIALNLIALGASLVADDQCTLTRVNGEIMASRPPSLPKAIEARGLGLLAVPGPDEAKIAAILDASAPARARLPERASCVIAGQRVPLLSNLEAGHSSAALYLYLKHGFYD